MEVVTTYWPVFTLAALALSFWLAFALRSRGRAHLKTTLQAHTAAHLAYVAERKEEMEARKSLRRTMQAMRLAHKSVRQLFWQVEPQWTK